MRALISVSPDAYADFLARLDAPPRPNERLQRSMRTPTPWEKCVRGMRPSAIMPWRPAQ
ncbi:MAG: DUF1778 domain-containing protein [Candidatus Competibacteraceae bacterium]|nr:MAG: DUF1778 domain-containing protein [Candidatus Competibacteraceae bacterium]